MIKLPTLSPRSVQLAFLLVASEISPKVVLSLFPLKISWFKSKPDQNLESHVGCCSCTLKKWLLKEFASTMQAATNADVQHPTSALLQPYLSSHISWSLCVTLTATFCLMLAHPDAPGTCLLQGCCSARLDSTGVRHGLLCHTCPADLQADTEQGCPKARLMLQHNPHPQPLLPALLPCVTPYPTCPQQLLPMAVKGVVGSWSQHGLPKNKHAQDSLYTHGLSY